MLRGILLYLSEQKRLQNFILRRRLAQRVARRFVAGETLDEAIAVTRDLNSRGMDVTLDHLGESVEREDQAIMATDDYIAILDRVAEEGVRTGISIKLTQIGLAIDQGLCRDNLKRIAEAARRDDNFVRIDMEASEYVESTLTLFHELHQEYGNLGAVIQSYLRRSERDVRKLAASAASVRLCKGAYQEPEKIAFQKKSEVDENYVHLLRILINSGSPLAVATHDSRMIESAKQLMRDTSNRDAPVEFQMLYGVRRDLQALLVEKGYRMRVYVPYGTEWYPYFMRRMAERPANLLFVLRALGGK
ncbi:MAG: proline dehydrogenase family protein [Gemmatimonadota bacterium]|nr:MAG: proline dehydrogenase family protein [Gemmatimonadota bacterium]